MLSVSKTLNILKDVGIIKSWQLVKLDASFDESGSLMETHINVDSNVLGISNEIYGRKAVLYFYCNNTDTANRVSTLLRNAGGNPSFQWCPDNPNNFEMQVSYFKGARWWE